MKNAIKILLMISLFGFTNMSCAPGIECPKISKVRTSKIKMKDLKKKKKRTYAVSAKTKINLNVNANYCSIY